MVFGLVRVQAFNVAMLKTILRNCEVPFRAKERKTDLIRLLTEVIQECNCRKESTVPFIEQKGQQYFFLQLNQLSFIVQVLVNLFFENSLVG